jgi:DNA-binding GntR family transcriptional regulator
MSIVVRTLSERIFEVLLERIVTGEIGLDAPIRQDALAAELGVSKIPLREAMARLEQEGLLSSQANRGYMVKPMSADQVDEIYALRLAIEPAAVAYAARHSDEAGRSAAREAFERLDAAAGGRLSEVAIRNREFHVALVRPGDRLLTTQLVERLAILAERYVVKHLEPAGRESRAHREHLELVEAFCAGDGARIEGLVAAHIKGTLADLREQFASASPG